MKGLRLFLIVIDDLMHFLVALILMTCSALILLKTIPSLLRPEIGNLLHVVNDVLLVLIIMELMWPIIRFLKREPFTLNPFLYIGIISSVRRILMIEAEHSVVAQASEHLPVWGSLWPVLAEMALKWLLFLRSPCLCGFFPGERRGETLKPVESPAEHIGLPEFHDFYSAGHEERAGIQGLRVYCLELHKFIVL